MNNKLKSGEENMNDNFLLNSKTAIKLYEDVKNLPVIDYHNHLSAEDICENKRYLNIYELWVKTDPYKHRAMRMCGIEEKFITGDAPDKEKFIKWCETVPKLVGNPLYHWTAMELELFEIDFMPNKENAEKIYDLCNKYLSDNQFDTTAVLDKFNVEFACPCMSLSDDVEKFKAFNNLSPSLRGDDIVAPGIENIKKLADASGMEIKCLKDYKEAVSKRLDAFKEAGCCFSDHALDNGFKFYPDDKENEKRFNALINGEIINEDKNILSSYLLAFLGGEYAKRGFVMQLHIGAQRKTSSKLRLAAGPTGGFAGIGNSIDAVSLTEFIDCLDCMKYGLPKIILFTLNPADNALISALSGSYSKNGVAGIITQGPAWWWCDHKKGIEEMLENTMVYSVLSNFVGMTTDSRSFLSFVRHDYFRRILCNFLGDKFETGEFRCEYDGLSELAVKLCYKNAKAVIWR